MSGLLYRNITLPNKGRITASGNRLIARFSNLPQPELERISAVAQPVFQEAGYAPEIWVQWDANQSDFEQVTINSTGSFADLAFAVPLYRPGITVELAEKNVDSFIALCGRVAELVESSSTKSSGWFRKLSPGKINQGVMPLFDMTREHAINSAVRLASFMKNLPRYQRSVEFLIDHVDLAAEEMSDFLDFIGFHHKATRAGLWHDPILCVSIILQPGHVIFRMPSVPRSPDPEALAENLKDIAKRFASEFGGQLTEQQSVDRVLMGWRAVLGQVNLKPGIEETLEIFPLNS